MKTLKHDFLMYHKINEILRFNPWRDEQKKVKASSKHAENGYRIFYYCVYLLHRSLDFSRIGTRK